MCFLASSKATTNDDRQALANSAPAIIFGPEPATERYTSDHRQAHSFGFHEKLLPSGLNLLERRLVESHRPSSSHLTTASSSLACSIVPNSAVGFPKLPKPSTRSPAFSSWSVAEGSESGGFMGLFVIWVISMVLCKRLAPFAATVQPS